MTEKDLTRVMFLPYNEEKYKDSFYSPLTNTFHKDNVGNIFDVSIDEDNMFYINGLKINGSRVKIIPKINLPDELFQM